MKYKLLFGMIVIFASCKTTVTQRANTRPPEAAVIISVLYRNEGETLGKILNIVAPLPISEIETVETANIIAGGTKRVVLKFGSLSVQQLNDLKTRLGECAGIIEVSVKKT